MSTHLEYRIASDVSICTDCRGVGFVLCGACEQRSVCKRCEGENKAKHVRLDSYFKALATQDTTKYYFGNPTPGDEEWSTPNSNLAPFLRGVLCATDSQHLVTITSELLAELYKHELEFRIVE